MMLLSKAWLKGKELFSIAFLINKKNHIEFQLTVVHMERIGLFKKRILAKRTENFVPMGSALEILPLNETD